MEKLSSVLYETNTNPDYRREEHRERSGRFVPTDRRNTTNFNSVVTTFAVLVNERYPNFTREDLEWMDLSEFEDIADLSIICSKVIRKRWDFFQQQKQQVTSTDKERKIA